MSDLWGIDVTYWWLADDSSYPPVLRALRDFIDFRAANAAQTDAKDADVRDMNGIFRTMNFEDQQDLPEHVMEMMKEDEGWFDAKGQYESSPEQTYV